MQDSMANHYCEITVGFIGTRLFSQLLFNVKKEENTNALNYWPYR